MSWNLRTVRGYDLLDVASALQKSIRRSDEKLAGYFAHELYASNYHNYVWKRLITIAAEDCDGIISAEIHALFEGFREVNTPKGKEKLKGRIFLSKAVLILCRAIKSRDSDHLQCLVYDHKVGITDKEIEKALEKHKDKFIELPEYTYDVHTKKGKRAGMTKKQFFIDEYKCLTPVPEQKSLFDNIVDEHFGLK
jgi:replication-associated recombination protein RarA